MKRHTAAFAQDDESATWKPEFAGRKSPDEFMPGATLGVNVGF